MRRGRYVRRKGLSTPQTLILVWLAELACASVLGSLVAVSMLNVRAAPAQDYAEIGTSAIQTVSALYTETAANAPPTPTRQATPTEPFTPPLLNEISTAPATQFIESTAYVYTTPTPFIFVYPTFHVYEAPTIAPYSSYEEFVPYEPSYNAPPESQSTGGCCKICTKGKPCGNTCISRSYTCH